MLGIARGSTYSWLVVLCIALVTLFTIRPAHSEDYGAGLVAIAVVVGASGLCLALVLLALIAYFVAWRRSQLLLVRDKLLVFVSLIALVCFAWPASWLVGN